MAATLITLVSFDGTNGGEPSGSLIFDTNGDLFGTTQNDTVFELEPTGFAALLTNLATGLGGPSGSLLADAKGDLFGTTAVGGASLDGTVFELVNNGGGSYTQVTLATFDGTNGTGPLGSLIANARGDLFGTTSGGGASSDGTVFQLVNNGNGNYTPVTLVNFNGTNGAEPHGSLIADAKGDLFGTTARGGTSNDGTIFEITPNGFSNTFTTLVNFNGTNGELPKGNLIADAKGDLFGTTAAGGASDDGTVFELVNNGGIYTFTTLISFTGNGGANPGGFPQGSLIADAKGDLFGTTQGTGFGSNFAGTVFELVNNGGGNYTLVNLVSFNGNDGEQLQGDLTPDTNGNLFGTTLVGGPGGQGTVFEITNSGFVMLGITGTVANQPVNDNATIQPFAQVVVADLNAAQSETVVVTPSNTANGTLTDPNAATDGSTIVNGVYSVTGTPTQVTADLDALVFHPTAHQVAPGGTVTTGFNIVVTDTAGATASDSMTSVVTTAIGVPPTITGTVANQHAYISVPTHLFAAVVIGDVNFGQRETVNVTPSPTTGGRLSDPHAATDGSHIVNGVYTVSGTAAAVTTDLQGLLFTATNTSNTNFTIKVTDTAGEVVTDHTTSVVGVSVFHPFFF